MVVRFEDLVKMPSRQLPGEVFQKGALGQTQNLYDFMLWLTECLRFHREELGMELGNGSLGISTQTFASAAFSWISSRKKFDSLVFFFLGVLPLQ